MRLIDADALVDFYEDKINAICGIHGMLDELAFFCRISKVLTDTPAVDAVPVVHGKFIKLDVDIAEHPYHCTVCRETLSHVTDSIVRGFKYCPYCGAKMEVWNDDRA